MKIETQIYLRPNMIGGGTTVTRDELVPTVVQIEQNYNRVQLFVLDVTLARELILELQLALQRFEAEEAEREG
jgi:hypothetical protein